MPEDYSGQVETPPPLLLAVLVQVVFEACERILRSSSNTQYQQQSTYFGRKAFTVEMQILQELLASAPASTFDRPFISHQGYGYPGSALVSFCVGLYSCARQPGALPSLPAVKMAGITEVNPFERVGELKTETRLQCEVVQKIVEAVESIDDNIDLMNVPQCRTAVPVLELLFGCMCGLFSSPRQEGHPEASQGTSRCARLTCGEREGCEEEDGHLVLRCVLLSEGISTRSSSVCIGGSGSEGEVPVRLPYACISRMSVLLTTLSPVQLLYLVGLRSTSGSLACHCPPSRHLLVAAFQTPHQYGSSKHSSRSKSVLTVGARALCKHAPKSEDGFWTGLDPANGGAKALPLRGSEASKNVQAAAALDRVLDSCVWINLHAMKSGPGRDSSVPSSAVRVLEVRTLTGHGARWVWAPRSKYEEEQISFRGFVEPMSVDGHENKWRH